MVARVTLEIALRKEFDYSIPEEFSDRVAVGSRVKVPFGHRQVLGVVTELAESSPQTNLKPILNVLGAQTLVTPQVLELARWIASYYCCAVETALKSVLPEAVRKEEAGWRERLHVHALTVVGEMPKLTPRQETIWRIIDEWRELPLQELLRLGETTAETVRKLEDKGLVCIAPKIDERDPYARELIVPTTPLTLNDEQVVAFQALVKAHDGLLRGEPAKPFLLFGVTGSGKTEVYLQAIQHVLVQGRGAIVLVPEISLTPQTVERFKARFSSGPHRTLVAVLHSHLSAGERHDEWHKIRQGRARIVIGARSAVFAPVHPLGLIIVDEEHEHSYSRRKRPATMPEMWRWCALSVRGRWCCWDRPHPRWRVSTMHAVENTPFSRWPSGWTTSDCRWCAWLICAKNPASPRAGLLRCSPNASGRRSPSVWSAASKRCCSSIGGAFQRRCNAPSAVMWPDAPIVRFR